MEVSSIILESMRWKKIKLTAFLSSCKNCLRVYRSAITVRAQSLLRNHSSGITVMHLIKTTSRSFVVSCSMPSSRVSWGHLRQWWFDPHSSLCWRTESGVLYVVTNPLTKWSSWTSLWPSRMNSHRLTTAASRVLSPTTFDQRLWRRRTLELTNLFPCCISSINWNDLRLKSLMPSLHLRRNNWH